MPHIFAVAYLQQMAGLMQGMDVRKSYTLHKILVIYIVVVQTRQHNITVPL